MEPWHFFLWTQHRLTSLLVADELTAAALQVAFSR
jgi:hypothetical protein